MTTPATSSTPESLATAWEKQSKWSRTATRLKAPVARSRTLVPSLLVVAAVLETVAASLSARPERATIARVLAGVGAAAVAAAAFFRSQYFSREALSRWVRSRAASERIKTEVYLFVTRAGDYATVDSPSRLLRESVEAIEHEVRDLEAFTVAAERRDPPKPFTLQEYVERRVNQQITSYFRADVDRMKRRLGLLKSAEVVLLFLAAVLGASTAAAGVTGWAAWLAVLTTIAGTLAAHIEGARYQHLIMIYSSAANRLESLRDGLDDHGGVDNVPPAVAAAFVKDAEDAIARANQSWMTNVQENPK